MELKRNRESKSHTDETNKRHNEENEDGNGVGGKCLRHKDESVGSDWEMELDE